MKILLLLFVFAFFILNGCKIDQQVPLNAYVLDFVVFADEVRSGKPQTVQLGKGQTVTFALPGKVADGDVIKIRDFPGERPFYIKVKLVERNEAKK